MSNNVDLYNRRLLYRLRRQHYQLLQAETAGQVHDLSHEGPIHHHGHKAEADKVAEQLREQLTRLQAEFDNYRKRVRRDEQQRINFATQGLVESMLPVLDNFQRAVENPGESVEALLMGIEMVHKQLIDILAQNGLTRVEAVGQPFDPNLHEAVTTEQTDQVPENHVVAVLQEGYRLKDRLIRPAMVKVARG